MAAEKTRRRLFSGLQPIAVSEANASVDDFSTKQRVDGPSASPGSSSGGSRKVLGEPLGLSHIELIEATICQAWFWEYAETLENSLEYRPRRGRPLEYKMFEGLLFEVTSAWRGSYRDIARTFDDPKTWQRLRETVAQAWPHHPHRRLSEKPISRSQFHRFRERYLDDDIIDELHQIVNDVTIDAVVHVGLLTPEAGSVNHPDTTQAATGDGTWIPSIYKHGARQIVDLTTGKVKRFDLEAVAYHTSDGITASGAHGRKLALAVVRSPHRGERIILDAAFKTPDKSEATVFCDMILNIQQRYPHLRKGLRGVTYDMALQAENIDRLLDAGIIPINKVPRTKGDKPAAVNLGEHAFTTTGGTRTATGVVAIEGTPCIIVLSDTGTDTYMPLKRVSTQINRHINTTTVYATWEVPDHPLTPPTLIGATTRIRHNSTTEERKTGKRRTRALRVIPEGTDPDFDRLFGLREDTESTNSHIKSLLPNGRARTVTTRRQRLNVLAYRITVMTKTLIMHHQRTGTPLHHWFGEHKPRVRAGPAKAA